MPKPLPKTLAVALTEQMLSTAEATFTDVTTIDPEIVYAGIMKAMSSPKLHDAVMQSAARIFERQASPVRRRKAAVA